MNRESKETSAKFGRREFIVGSAVVLGGLAVRTQPLFAAETAEAVLPATLGYVLGSEPSIDASGSSPLPRNDFTGLPSTVISAAERIQGDFVFLRDGARVRIIGLFGSPGQDPPQPRVSSVDVLYAVDGDAVPFFAWRRDDSRRTNALTPVAFNVPVTNERGIAIRMSAAAPSRRRPSRRDLVSTQPSNGSAQLELTLSGGSGAPKLWRGVYFAAMAPGGAAIDWSSVQFSGKLESPLVDGLGRPAGFEYLMLSIDYAKPTDPPA